MRATRLFRLTLLAAAIGNLGGALAADVLISADRMLDVRTGKMVASPQILVRDGRVVEVKEGAGSISAPGAKLVALLGMTLSPGLIDMHVHLTSGEFS